jgi:hypothetical protein
MGASVVPVQENPGDRITRTIAAMRAQGATEHDVETYLTQVEGLKPQESMAKGVGRALVQGATYNFGDELGLTNRGAEKAFQQAHPIADLLAKMAGGVVAPAAAVIAAPSLATLAGAVGLGAATGALSGAGEAETGRGKAALTGGLLGGATGAAGYGVGKAAGAVAGTVLDRMHPERAVARAAGNVIAPATEARMAEVAQLAPGGSSIATATVPQGQNSVSRFMSMVRGIGASPKAAQQAETQLAGQVSALKQGTQAIGAQMDALHGDVPVTPSLVNTLKQVTDVLGSKADFNPGSQPGTLEMADMRDALARLRYAVRQAEKRGTEANGPTLYELKSAQNALANEIYTHSPEFAQLDQQYGALKGELRQVAKLQKTVQLSRQNYAGNEAYKATAGSLGGSLPRGSHGVVMTALDKILTNKAGAADAVAQYITKPGGPENVQALLDLIPKSSTVTPRARAAGIAALIPALQGLLTPPSP